MILVILKNCYNLPKKIQYEILKVSQSISVGGETMNSNNNNSSMKMRVPGAKQAIDKMKYEIANEQIGRASCRERV